MRTAVGLEDGLSLCGDRCMWDTPTFIMADQKSCQQIWIQNSRKEEWPIPSPTPQWSHLFWCSINTPCRKSTHFWLWKFLINNHYKTIYEQECIPVGCVPPTAVAIWWWVFARGWQPRGLSAQGVCLPRGCLSGGVHLPPWTEFVTHSCENISFPQLHLRMVTIQNWVLFL